MKTITISLFLILSLPILKVYPHNYTDYNGATGGWEHKLEDDLLYKVVKQRGGSVEQIDEVKKNDDGEAINRLHYHHFKDSNGNVIRTESYCFPIDSEPNTGGNDGTPRTPQNPQEEREGQNQGNTPGGENSGGRGNGDPESTPQTPQNLQEEREGQNQGNTPGGENSGGRGSGDPESTPPVDAGTPQQTRGAVGSGVKPTHSNDVLVTEYMVRDFCKWQSKLPQWLELYNNGSLPITLQGWSIRIFRHAYGQKTQEDIALPDYTIEPSDTVLLVTKLANPNWTTVDAEKVINLGTGNVLKLGWVLFNSGGTVINETEHPHKPPHIPEWHRVSYERYSNAETYEDFDEFTYYYGHNQEYSTAGHHAFMRGAAPALIPLKKATMWGSLKRPED